MGPCVPHTVMYSLEGAISSDVTCSAMTPAKYGGCTEHSVHLANFNRSLDRSRLAAPAMIGYTQFSRHLYEVSGPYSHS